MLLFWRFQQGTNKLLYVQENRTPFPTNKKPFKLNYPCCHSPWLWCQAWSDSLWRPRWPPCQAPAHWETSQSWWSCTSVEGSEGLLGLLNVCVCKWSLEKHISAPPLTQRVSTLFCQKSVDLNRSKCIFSVCPSDLFRLEKLLIRWNFHLLSYEVCDFIPKQSELVWSLSSTAECFLVWQKPSPERQACRLHRRSPLHPAPPGNNTVHCNCSYSEDVQWNCSGMLASH